MNMWNIGYRNLMHRKSMTALALIGLILGVATVITLVSITTGIRNMVIERTSETKGIIIYGNDQTHGSILPKLSMNDVSKVEKINGVRNVCPRVIYFPKSIEGVFHDASSIDSSFKTTVIGVRPQSETKKLSGPLTTRGNIIRGRYLLPTDSKTVVLGAEIANDYKKTVGSSFKIDGEKFTVVGIAKTGLKKTDNMALITYWDAEELAGLDKDIVTMAFVEADNPSDISKITNLIKARLPRIRVISTEEFAEVFSELLNNVGAFLWAISGIAAIVAAVNIINTMLMSIMEREKEFGVMRAIGWTAGDVIKLVMVESIIIGVVGGIFGVVLGTIAVEVIKTILNIRMLVDATLAIEAWAFSVIIGTVAGAYPAWKASKLNPLEAIRSE